MSRHTLLAIVVLSLVSSSILTAGDVYTGSKPIAFSVKDNNILDKRTELQKLADKVNEMEFFLDEALHSLDHHEQRIEELEDALADSAAYQVLLEDLSGIMNFDGDELTLAAERINLNATRVDINAERTTIDDLEVDDLDADDVKVDTLTAEEVDSKVYSPGAGNIW